MSKNQFTFNDLPEVLGELCDRIASMESLLTEKLSKQNEVKENTHVPMTVQEACAYLKMPLSTFYYKVKKDDIPVIKQGKHLYIYRDELDKWLESSRKTAVPQSFEVEKCAEFIKTIFPHELKNATLFYLSKNLRTTGICKIPLDIPLKGEYYFNCLKKTDDETAVLTD